MLMELTYEDRKAIRIARETGQALPCKECCGSGLKDPGEIGQCDDCRGTGADFCKHHCVNCEGMDHHWMPDCDEDTGEPQMVCKHCPIVRPYLNEDEDE